MGPEGTDGSPRGDEGPVVTVLDPQTLALPDWYGNNRIDSLRNIVRDGRVSLMFLIPGTPKDTLNYLCPLTSISPVRFLVLSTFARIPSVISSTFAGANFAEGNLLASVIVLGITSAVGLLGIRYEHVLTDHLNRSAARFRERMNSGKHQ